jgi:hypothetical protein
MKEKRNISFKNMEIRSLQEDSRKIIIGVIPYNSPSVPIFGVTEIIDKR